MSNEKPLFDPDGLPDESRLKREAQFDLELVEKGVDPNDIAAARSIARNWLKTSPDAEAIRQEFTVDEELNDE